MAEALRSLHLSDQKIPETLKNVSLTEFLTELVAKATTFGGINKQQGTSLYTLGSKMMTLAKDKPVVKEYLNVVIRWIMNGDIVMEPQLSAAMDFARNNFLAAVDEDKLRQYCGAGVTVTSEEIEDTVKSVIAANRDALVAQRYSFNVGKLLMEIRKQLKWADGSKVKTEVDLRVLELLGPKTEEELNPQRKKKAPKDAQKAPAKETSKTAGAKAKEESPVVDGAPTIEELMRTRANFHKVGENYKTDGYPLTKNTEHLLKEHVKRVSGKVVTRFPPEPNGILHLGHAKAIGINFGFAKAHGGSCNLRFDDTNPEKEEEKFFLAIEEMVKWLGYKPARITYSSDNFDQLYAWAVELIKKDLAYVCHQTVEEMRGFNVKESPFRNRPSAESLQLFEDMKNGKFDEGAATLRLKTVLEEGKIDPVAYRIKYVAHHRTGNKWCIYPTYDYTHCLCDSIEDITHSMCTKEFQSRRSSYYWLCNALNIYCPVQWEYGRLNIEYTVVSKRKIQKLITTRVVRDWDDPRLFTLPALRRRGVPAEAINSFIAGLGLTGSQMVINPTALDAVVRDYLNVNAPRTMAVLEPLKVQIQNFASLKLPSKFAVRDFPAMPSVPAISTAEHEVAVSDVVFIEASDYRKDNTDKKFRRLTKEQPVALKYLGLVLSVVEEVLDKVGNVCELVVTAEKATDQNRPKAFIHWVSNPMKCEVRMYDRLFKHKNPEDAEVVPGGFLEDCDTDSLTVLRNVYVDKYLASSKVYDKFQFERTGFFSVDQDSTNGNLVFNRTVMLKEDAGK